MEWYLRQAECLRRELKDLSLKDNDWVFKSWDQDGVEIVKVHYLDIVWNVVKIAVVIVVYTPILLWQIRFQIFE